MQRLCIFCKHFDFDSGSPGYSEYTPAIGMTMGCDKLIWDEETVEDIREGNKFAFNCEFYELSDDAKEMGAPE